MSVVYVTQNVRSGPGEGVPRFDITTAGDHGEIKILLSSVASAFCTVPVSQQLRDGLRHFSDSDFLLPIGDPAIMLMAGVIASQRTGGKLNILKWDRKSRKYIKVRFEL